MNNILKTNIKEEIPLSLLEKLDAIKFKSKKSREHALKLIAVVLHSMDDEDAEPNGFNKELGVVFIRKYLTSYNFYKEYFLEHLQGQVNNKNFSEAILQTDGIYCVGFYGKHYRINPKYLDVPTEEINIEVELDCLNDLFPNILKHFNYSASLIKINKSIDKIDVQIKEQMELSSVVFHIGGNAVYYHGGKENLGLITSGETKIPHEIKLTNIYDKWFTRKEVDKLIELKNEKAGENLFFLLKERNKKNRCKYDIINLKQFQEAKKQQFLKRVNKKVKKVISGKWTPLISSSNGRFNHLLSNLDNFCFDFLNMANEPIVSYDLKCS